MSDIVERLREQAGWYSDGHGPLHKEAADEIERLLAEIEKLDRRLVLAWETIGERDAEIERLLAERKYLGELHRQEWEAQVARAEKAEAEIEKLRVERDAQYDENVNRIAAEGAAILRAEAAEAEIERLR